MKYTVKMIIKYTVETGEVCIEESMVMFSAGSFDEAYEKAERYVEENGVCAPWINTEGKRVTAEITYADCFSVYDDEEPVEVYSTMIRPDAELTETEIVSVLKMSGTAEELIKFRQRFN